MDANMNRKNLYNSLCKAVSAYKENNKGTTLGVAASNYVYETYQEVYDEIKLHHPMLDPFYDSSQVEAFLNAVADLIPVKYSDKVTASNVPEAAEKHADAHEKDDFKDVIKIPEGTEIDMERSDFKKGIIYLKSSCITSFEDVLDKIRHTEILMHSDMYSFYSSGTSSYSDGRYGKYLEVLTKLMIIATQLNEGWWPSDSEGCVLSSGKDGISIEPFSDAYPLGGAAFKDYETAETALSMLTDKEKAILTDINLYSKRR